MNEDEEMIKRWVATMEGDPDLEQIVFDAIKDLPEREAELQKLIESQNIEAIQLIAHSLKGSTGSIGMLELYELFVKMDAECKKLKDSNINIIKDYFKEIKSIINRIPKKYF